MNILFATTEAVPFAKTGGLGDVCGALPVELERLGHRVGLIMPAFRQIHEAGLPIDRTSLQVEVPIGSKTAAGRLLRSHLPESNVPVFFIEQPHYFDRAELYTADGSDYQDNCERFVFFSRAVLEAIRLLELQVDVLHTHDWQTGLVPALLKAEYQALPGYENIATLLTIHNLSYQGVFWHWDMLLTGLDWKYFNWRQMEFYGKLNLLKTALAFTDAISTVSRRYAEEIQSPPLGCGLESVLAHRKADLFGIVNGVDYRIWNPETDPHLPARYNVDNWQQGKAECKRALQQEVGLPQAPRAPLAGLIGRLVDQKGCDLVVQVVQDWVQTSDAQFVVLGTGAPKYHELFSLLAERFPNKVAVRLEFSDPLAHRIEAGSDIFLMPSRYEPCGLNQLYSLRYGSVPVVRATGGLADTIQDATSEAVKAGTATGFSFTETSAAALSETLRRACDMYQRQPELWQQIVVTGMRQDWSWRNSAEQYIQLYETTAARAKRAVYT